MPLQIIEKGKISSYIVLGAQTVVETEFEGRIIYVRDGIGNRSGPCIDLHFLWYFFVTATGREDKNNTQDGSMEPLIANYAHKSHKDSFMGGLIIFGRRPSGNRPKIIRSIL